MSDPIAIASSKRISQDELVDFCRLVGADITPEDTFLACLSRQNLHVWIALTDEPFDEEERQQIAQRLGSQPVTIIILEISRTPGSMGLAVEFAGKFSKQWPCVVDDLRGRIYTEEEFPKLLAL